MVNVFDIEHSGVQSSSKLVQVHERDASWKNKLDMKIL